MTDGKLNVKHVAIVAHVNQPNLPPEHLARYFLQNQIDEFLYIQHSFSERPDRRSIATWYKSGQVHRTFQTLDYRWLPEPLVYVKEWLSTWCWLVRTGLRWEMIVCADGLCSNFALTLPKRRRGRVAFWNLDFVPERRFRNGLKNWFYGKINMRAAFGVDEMWDHTPKMVEAKKEVLGLTPADYAMHRVVPQGIWARNVARFSYGDCPRNVVVFLGQLSEKQGLQFAIRAIREIVLSVPDFRLKVIGEGAYRSTLDDLIADEGVGEHVEFTGLVADYDDVVKEVASGCLGIAPFARAADTFTKFGSDPGKLKVYLGCGLPVLTTDVPWSAEEIERRRCGFIITEDPHDIAEKVIRLMTDAELNDEFRRNAAAYAHDFDYETIFGAIFTDPEA